MRYRDIIIQFVIAGFISIFLALVFASFEYSSKGSTYAITNFRDATPYLFYFIGAAIPSLMIGLIFRLNLKIKNWLRKNYWINIASCVLGIALCLYSIADSNIIIDEYRMDGMNFEYWHPKHSFQLSGWFIMMFSALNIYLPEK